MKKLTRKEITNKRKGQSRRARHNKSLSPHILLNERWVVTPPSGGKQKAMAFLTEKQATDVAVAIVANHGVSVEVDHQIMTENGWGSSPGE